MALYKYFKKALGAVLYPNRPLSDHMPSQAISSANREMLGFGSPGHRAKQWLHKYSTYGRCAIFSTKKSLFLPSLVDPYPSARVHVLGEVDTLNYEGVSFMLPVPAPTASYNFTKTLFAKLNFSVDLRDIYICSPRNVSALQYQHQILLLRRTQRNWVDRGA